jgi:hypothetical protein
MAKRHTTRKATTTPEQSEVRRLKFDFIKSTFFRVVHVDGVYGGPTGQGNIAMTVFSERGPIPKQVVHPITGEGIGEELKDERVSRDAIVREAEVCMMLTLPAAESMRAWLDQHIKGLKTAVQKQQKTNT